MDCRTILTKLDALQEENLSRLEQPIVDHLHDCEDCLKHFRFRQQFDRIFKSSLQASDVPYDLEARLLQKLTNPELVALPSRSLFSSWFSSRRIKQWSTAAACSLVIFACLFWIRWDQQHRLNYTKASHQLAQYFQSQNNNKWDELEQFDGNFRIDLLDHSLSRMMSLSAPRGLDLGGDRRQDVAAFRFRTREAAGILVVLPQERYFGAMRAKAPAYSRIPNGFQWRSAEHKLIYLCFVYDGSDQKLVERLFHSWT